MGRSLRGGREGGTEVEKERGVEGQRSGGGWWKQWVGERGGQDEGQSTGECGVAGRITGVDFAAKE